MSEYEHVKKSRDKRKNQMLYVMGEKCCLCGYNKCVAALEFHHIDPKQKDLSFNKAKNMSWDKIEQELKKCVLLCANCHREVHYNDSEFQLTSSFDIDKALEISQEVNEVKNGKAYYCLECGKLVSYGNSLCPECSAIKRRVVERPSREDLKEMIREKPFTQIGRLFNVSDNAVKKWCLSYNLPHKKTDIKKYTDDEWSKI